MTKLATSRNLTDRAHRYRANATPPPGPKHCAFCGSRENVEVGHINGKEQDGDQLNLIWTCRSCNVKTANTMRKAGLGRLTHQYNPADKGAASSRQWSLAVLSMKGEADPEVAMSVKDAVAMIRATPPRQRSFYASQIRHMRTQQQRARKNPAESGKQYRLAQAVLSGQAKKITSMTKKVAQEIVDKTPEKLRSAFAKGNPKGKKNLFGLGKSRVMSSSKLSRQAFQAGQTGTASDQKFEAWLKPKVKIDDLSSSLKSQLRKEYWKGADAKNEAKSKPVRQAAAKTSSGGASKSQYGPYYEKLSPADQTKIRSLVGNPAKNPTWRLRQSEAQAFVFETRTGVHEADIIRPGHSMESETFTGPHSFRSATSWARLRLHEVANPAGCKVKIFKRGNAKRNPIDKAEKAYEEFHGIPSKEILEYQEQEHRHSVLWGIGPLISMKVVNVQGNKEVEIFAPDPQEAKLGDVVMLTASEDGRQFIPVGGDQKLKLGGLESFGITDADVRDHMLIGTIVQLTYRTKKSFEKHGKEEVDFYHDLGKEGSKGICPVLIYKPRNPSMEIAGGRYQIAKPEGALGGVSPGIVG